MKKIQLGFGFWLFIMSLLMAAFIIWVSTAFQDAKGKKVAAQTSREVALTCTIDMATQFHIHPYLKIVISGKEQEIPANIGINTLCMNAIHTHDGSGTIHIESPVKKDFTLGDFFAVWRKSFTKEQVLNTKLSAQDQILITVNGKKVRAFDQTVMHDNDQILIAVN